MDDQQHHAQKVEDLHEHSHGLQQLENIMDIGRFVSDNFRYVMLDLSNRVLSELSLSASLLVVTPGVVVPSVGDLNETHEKGQKSKEL